MTHSSGISVTKQLEDAFGDARTKQTVRWIKVQIENEALIPVKTSNVSGDQQSDWSSFAGELLPKTPAYILYRLDSKNMQGYEWILVAYVPDGSTVRDRMLYASSRDNLKKQLGYSYFTEDLYGSSVEDVTYQAYLDFKQRKIIDNSVMTATEIQSRSHATAELAVGVSKEYVHSVKFPMSVEATQQLKHIADGSINLVQLFVDPTKETIELGKATKTDINGLRSSIPANEPRFTIYRWDHSHGGQSHSSIVFIYSSSDDAPIKLKMLYSTVKAVANGSAEDQGLKIDKRMEITDPNEVTEAALIELLHPQTEAQKLTFNKPSRPGRGPSRAPTRK